MHLGGDCHPAGTLIVPTFGATNWFSRKCLPQPSLNSKSSCRTVSRRRKAPVVGVAIDLVDPFTSTASLSGAGRREQRVQRGRRGRCQGPADPREFRCGFQSRHHSRIVVAVRHRTPPRNRLRITLVRGEYEPKGANFISPEMMIESSQRCVLRLAGPFVRCAPLSCCADGPVTTSLSWRSPACGSPCTPPASASQGHDFASPSGTPSVAPSMGEI